MPTVSYVYFDLDDTLLDHGHAERSALRDVQAEYKEWLGSHDLATIQETYHEINAPLWRAYAEKEIDRATLQHVRFEQLVGSFDAHGLDSTAVGEYYMLRYRCHWKYEEGAREAFHKVAEKLPVGIMTNGFAGTQRAKLDAFPELRDRCHSVVISEEVGHLKPQLPLFRHAEKLADTDPASILYVGDSYHSDVRGATNAGWQMAWYRKNGDTQEEAGVYAFTDWDAAVDEIIGRSQT